MQLISYASKGIHIVRMQEIRYLCNNVKLQCGGQVKSPELCRQVSSTLAKYLHDLVK